MPTGTFNGNRPWALCVILMVDRISCFSQMHREIMQATDSIKELEEQIEVMTEEMAKVCVLWLVKTFWCLIVTCCKGLFTLNVF